MSAEPLADPAALAGLISVAARTVATRPPVLALRVQQAAQALGVSEDYFAKQIAPDLRMVRDGRLKLVPVRELEAWLDRHAAYAIEPRRR